MKSIESGEQRNHSRWPGLILSLFVPGFGLIRAGNIRRGVTWLVGLYVGSIVFSAAFALEFVPMLVGIVSFLMLVAASLWMLFDSLRPGRMSPRLWVLFVGAVILLFFLPEPGSFIAKSLRVPTGAMEPTLQGARDGNTPDHVVVDRLSYLFHKPERGDLVVFRAPAIPQFELDRGNGEILLTKRLVGLPGETIEIRDGHIFADGRELGRDDGIPSISYVTYTPSSFPGKMNGDAYVLGDGEYFVLGDNSPNSADSRLWGYVPESTIFGKATKIYFPFSRMGGISGP